MTTTTQQQFWCEQAQGTIYCTQHAGSYLTSAITNNPTAHTHVTPLGVWDLMTADEVAEFTEFLRDAVRADFDSICEECNHNRKATQ